MAINVVCPNGHKLTAADRFAGRRIRCPHCDAVVVLPEAEEETAITAEPRRPPARPRRPPAAEPEEDDEEQDEEEEEDEEEERPRKKRKRKEDEDEDDEEEKKPRARKKRKKKKVALPDDEKKEDLNILDQLFLNTAGPIFLVISCCFAGIGLILGILGVCLCKHPEARERALFVLMLSGVVVLVSVAVAVIRMQSESGF